MKLRGVLARAGSPSASWRCSWQWRPRAARLYRTPKGSPRLGSESSPLRPGSYRFLQLGEGEPYTVREELASANPERAEKRTSLAYFGQLSDFQLADEESPGPAGDHRPALDAAQSPLWRRLAAVGGARAPDRRLDDPPDGPVRDGQPGRQWRRIAQPDGLHDRHRRLRRQPAAQRDRMGADPARGRHAEPQQRRRQEKILQPALPDLLVPGAAEAARYTGVQDYNDYFEGTFPEFYDPNSPRDRTRPGPNTRA